MSLPNSGWKNKAGTGTRTCKCGSWKRHWINFSDKSWSSKCSVKGCSNKPTLGAAHVLNKDVEGERIVPCAIVAIKLTESFSLKGSVTCVPAKISITCDK